jgi:F0F1-type ATP synthase assembly protein I
LQVIVVEGTPMNNPTPRDYGDTERAMGVAYSVIGTVVLGAAGYALDGWLHTRPWLAVAGLVLGAVISLIGVRTLIRDRSGC